VTILLQRSLRMNGLGQTIKDVLFNEPQEA
jgi:hypothetical protein